MELSRYTRFDRILIGYDGSEESEKAVDAAIMIARRLDAYVLALAVARPALVAAIAGARAPAAARAASPTISTTIFRSDRAALIESTVRR